MVRRKTRRERWRIFEGKAGFSCSISMILAGGDKK
jgi:hypothetical protein